jgi:sphingolipid delta-4 desaturase
LSATVPDRSSRFTEVDYPEPHHGRARRLLRDHPELRELTGRNPWTAAITAAVVCLQVGVAASVARAPWWVVLAVAWLVGAAATHTLWVVIHEATHNLIARRRRGNRIVALVANLPMVLPSAESFRIYHLEHHAHQGDYQRDADLPSEWEARLVGRGLLGKLAWQLGFTVFQALRVARFGDGVPFFTPWVATNIAVSLTFDVAVASVLGPRALVYLAASLVFAVGPHPLGARWIQEHYLVWGDLQETSSYYGPLNTVALNVGYHNEHHDFPGVPWNRLPRVKALAPELYDHLHSHRSWTRLWLRFLLDEQITLFSRVTRPGRRSAELATTRPDRGVRPATPAVGVGVLTDWTAGDGPDPWPHAGDRAQRDPV